MGLWINILLLLIGFCFIFFDAWTSGLFLIGFLLLGAVSIIAKKGAYLFGGVLLAVILKIWMWYQAIPSIPIPFPFKWW